MPLTSVSVFQMDSNVPPDSSGLQLRGSGRSLKERRHGLVLQNWQLLGWGITLSWYSPEGLTGLGMLVLLFCLMNCSLKYRCLLRPMARASPHIPDTSCNFFLLNTQRRLLRNTLGCLFHEVNEPSYMCQWMQLWEVMNDCDIQVAQIWHSVEKWRSRGPHQTREMSFILCKGP